MTDKKHIHIFSGITRKASVIVLLAAVHIMVSCNKNSFDNRQLSDKMVILSEITAGDSATIPIGSTVPAGVGSEISFDKMTGIDAVITGQNGSVESLELNQAPYFISNPMAVYTGTIPFQYNTAYTITATDSRLGTATATTSIPDNFSVSETESETDDLQGKKVLRFAFKLNDAGGEKNYYIFEAVKQLATLSKYFYWQGVKYDYNQQQGYNLYQQVKNNNGVILMLDTILTPQYIRLNVYTKDTHTGNADINSLDSPYHRIFITDTLFDGNTYETEFWIAMDQFTAANNQETGVVQVQVKSVSKELYVYLLQYEKYNQDFGIFSISGLHSPVGNIQNGFGVFGGSVRKQWSFYYDPLQ